MSLSIVTGCTLFCSGCGPEEYKKFLADKLIFMSGVMIRGERRHPFILVAHKGNPYVVYFRARDGNPMGDAESFNLILAPARDRSPV